MKKTKFFRYAALALAAVCALTLAGCPADPADPDPDPALRGSWTNNATGDKIPGLVKTFTIHDNFNFTASINPLFIGAYNNAIKNGKNETEAEAAANAALAEKTEEEVRWTVTGSLTAEGGVRYHMSNLTETSVPPKPPLSSFGKTAAEEVAFFIGPVKITFTDTGKNEFNFEGAGGFAPERVTEFFGGNYTRK
jgi:hypothetical protein